MMDLMNIYSLTVFLVVCVCYYNSLQCGFVFDDVSAIKENKDLRPYTPLLNLFWNDFWGTPMHKERSHKSYRPLCVLTFRLNYAISELEPMSYHLVNLVLHGIVCIMYLRMCRMFFSQSTSFLASILFAVHPIHTEAVTGVVGRAEALSSVFFLAAFMCYAQKTRGRTKSGKTYTRWKYLCLTVILVTIAMLCKEQGITVIGVCCVYEVFITQKMTFPQILRVLNSFMHCKPHFPPWLREAVIRAGFLVGSTIFLLFARIKVMGAQLPVFTRFDNPASVSPFPARQLTFNYLLPVNVWLLLDPSQLCCDWTMGTIPVIRSILDLRNTATIAFYVVLGKFIHFALTQQHGTRPKNIIMCLSFMTLPFIPASNLFFPVGFVVAERILYTPSMGFTMLVALGFEIIVKKNEKLKKILWALMVILILTHTMKTIVRNNDWESEYSLFKAALKTNKNNAKLYNNVGHALENKDQFSEALNYFQKAASVQPDDIGAHINIGRTFNNLQQHADAEKSYRTALGLMPPVKPGQSYTTRIAPNHLNVFVNLANLISKNASRLEEANTLYKQAISMRADWIQAYINRGDVLLKLNRTLEAQQQYETALRYEPDNSDVHYNLGVVFLEQGRTQEAIKCFEEALRFDPEHKQTLFNSAVLIQETGDPRMRPAAYKRLNKLVEKDPNDAKLYFNLGMLATDDKKLNDAEFYFKKAVQLKPDFRSALFNLALLLNNDVKRPMDAVPYLKQLLKYYPDHTKGLILMGDININILKDIKAAEENFKQILQNDPGNVQANHNLCVVFFEQGQLSKAEKCLTHALRLAPHEKYIENHLNIVRGKIAAAQKQMNQNRNGHKSSSSQSNAEKTRNGAK
ncbi:protein O-mannosyl-transferase TMTC3-like isoform X2 [Tubulanus polymorphus]